jgi:hypothetical protein
MKIVKEENNFDNIKENDIIYQVLKYSEYQSLKLSKISYQGCYVSPIHGLLELYVVEKLKDSIKCKSKDNPSLNFILDKNDQIFQSKQEAANFTFEKDKQSNSDYRFNFINNPQATKKIIDDLHKVVNLFSYLGTDNE